jgi:hypothetical protein
MRMHKFHKISDGRVQKLSDVSEGKGAEEKQPRKE